MKEESKGQDTRKNHHVPPPEKIEVIVIPRETADTVKMKTDL